MACRSFPCFRLGLPATELRGFSGVLNSTSNVVLTEMEKGLSFDEAVRRAQALGIAETDPANDLDGWDSAVKVVALAIILMGVPVKLEQVRRTGIRELERGKNPLRARCRHALQVGLPRGAPRRGRGLPACGRSCCLPVIRWRIWKAPARRFVSIWMCSGCRWSSTIPESRRPDTVCWRIFCARFARQFRAGIFSQEKLPPDSEGGLYEVARKSRFMSSRPAGRASLGLTCTRESEIIAAA